MTARPRSCDVAVIGAGVIGLSVAEELLSHGMSVAVVDRREAGREASWAGAGILPPGSRYSEHPAIEQLAAVSHGVNARLSERLLELTGLDDGYRRCGALYVATSIEQRAYFAALFARWRARDIRVDAVDEAEFMELAPYASDELRRQAAQGSAHHVPDEAQVRNPRRLKALAQLCRVWGGAIIEHDEVISLEESAGQVSLKLASGTPITAAKVVVANGAWASRFLPPSIQVGPVRGQMLLLARGPHDPPIDRILHVESQYLTPRTDGRVLAGSTVEDAGFDKSNTAEACAALLAFVDRCGLGRLRLEQTWAGLRPASSDELPYIGALSERVFVAAGHFRAGLQFASVTAMLIRELMLGQTPSMDVTPFRIDR